MTMIIRIIILLSFKTFFIYMKCSRPDSAATPKYHLIEKCHRSKLGIAAKANYSSLTRCKRFGIEKRALALNFSPYIRSKPVEYTCEALQCAESEGGISLANDTRFDYYSIYARPLPHINSSCISATGMFVILPNKFNYTESQTECKNISAILAEVTSEYRTDALAQSLLTNSVDAAYVGMKRNDNDRAFISEDGDSLDCVTYRAWAPGHPQRNSNMSCVVLTKHRTWKTVACDDKYEALCELIPKGPYRKGSIFKNMNNQHFYTYI